MSDTASSSTRPAPIAFRDADLEPDLAARAKEHASLGLVAKRDLARYYTTLRRELRTVAGALTRGEKLALCDVSRGTLWDSTSVGFLWAEVADTDPADLEQWEVDRDALVAKLRAFTPTQTLALVDALERWWLLASVSDHDEGLRAVGLTRES